LLNFLSTIFLKKSLKIRGLLPATNLEIASISASNRLRLLSIGQANANTEYPNTPAQIKLPNWSRTNLSGRMPSSLVRLTFNRVEFDTFRILNIFKKRHQQRTFTFALVGSYAISIGIYECVLVGCRRLFRHSAAIRKY
jgi:hypothetical protein